MKKRLFVALGATDIYSDALPYLKKLKTNFGKKDISIQWAPGENWHITLVFLGDTQVAKIPSLIEKIGEICRVASPFKLHISGFGGFPDIREARVVWMGVQRSQTLLNLQTDIEKSTGAVENREYWPHLTAGRLRNKRNISDAVSPVVRKKIGDLWVNEVRLYESQLTHPFPRYNVIEKFTLLGSENHLEK